MLRVCTAWHAVIHNIVDDCMRNEDLGMCVAVGEDWNATSLVIDQISDLPFLLSPDVIPSSS